MAEKLLRKERVRLLESKRRLNDEEIREYMQLLDVDTQEFSESASDSGSEIEIQQREEEDDPISSFTQHPTLSIASNKQISMQAAENSTTLPILDAPLAASSPISRHILPQPELAETTSAEFEPVFQELLPARSTDIQLYFSSPPKSFQELLNSETELDFDIPDFPIRLHTPTAGSQNYGDDILLQTSAVGSNCNMPIEMQKSPETPGVTNEKVYNSAAGMS